MRMYYELSEPVLARVRSKPSGAAQQEAERCDLHSQRERVTITLQETYAVVVAKLGFKPSFTKQGGKQDVFRRPCDKVSSRHPWLRRHSAIHGQRMSHRAGYPARLHQGFKALVWHDDRMVDQVYRDLLSTRRANQTSTQLLIKPPHTGTPSNLSLIHISEPTRLGMNSYAVF